MYLTHQLYLQTYTDHQHRQDRPLGVKYDVHLYTVKCRLEAHPTHTYNPPPVEGPSKCKQKITSDYKPPSKYIEMNSIYIVTI